MLFRKKHHFLTNLTDCNPLKLKKWIQTPSSWLQLSSTVNVKFLCEAFNSPRCSDLCGPQLAAHYSTEASLPYKPCCSRFNQSAEECIFVKGVCAWLHIYQKILVFWVWDGEPVQARGCVTRNTMSWTDRRSVCGGKHAPGCRRVTVRQTRRSCIRINKQNAMKASCRTLCVRL